VSSAREPRILAGRYRLEEVIGRGGMSTVYRGTDLSLHRVVAVKVALDPLVEESPIYLARFTREAQSAAAIGHPGVVTVYDAGADGPTRFIVMEFVPGKSLADILKEERPLDPERAANIAAQVADALSAAHAAGIIHRDIKPGNIMVEPSGSVKVLDFGIARAVDGHSLTQTATVLGTSAYMSPEQALGQPVDARSDIYSLGCVLYEMLTGQPPFVADVAAAVMHQHVRVAPKPAIERNPAIPASLNTLVMEMLAKQPKDRPQTAAEVRDRIVAAISQDPQADALTTLAMAAAAPTAATVPIEATHIPPAAESSAPGPRAQTPTAPRRREARQPPPTEPPPRKSRTGLWALIAVIAALLLGGGAALALRGGSHNSTSSTSSSHSTPAISHATTHSTTPPPTTSTPKTTTSTQKTTTSTPKTTTSTPKTTTSTAKTTTTTRTQAPTTSNAPTTSTNAPTTSTPGAGIGPATP
jgi:eukaryotic-like serine/threonine-protein kinase